MRVTAALCSLYVAATLLADELPIPSTGEVRLKSGRVVDYTLHFDRNSLRDSLRYEDGLIALTSSGVLLRFELPAIQLIRERIDTVEVTCLGRGEGEAILAGLADGRICRVDPVTLGLTDLAKLPAEPQWVGWSKSEGNRPAGLLAVTQHMKSVERDGEHWNEPYSLVHDLATGKTLLFEDGWEVKTTLLDRAGRLWLGADKGEWGGRVTRFDLSKGTVTTIKPPPARAPGGAGWWLGVYGFVELRDGQVWAYGGITHLGSIIGEIVRVDEVEPQRLGTFTGLRAYKQASDPNRPKMPITHVVEDNNGLLVFSYSDVSRVDKALKSWNKVATLDIQYRWGRPEVGAESSVCAVHSPSREGQPCLIATIGDGYVALDGKKTTTHAIPGQFGAAYITGIENTSEGILFFEVDDELPVLRERNSATWSLGANGWEIATLAPPFETNPATKGAERVSERHPDGLIWRVPKAWYKTRVLVGPGRMIYTVSSATDFTVGTRTTARRVDGKSVRLGRETSSLYASYSFITADGTLWNAFFDSLRRFQNGRWETVQALPKESCPSGSIKPLNSNGPPWLLLANFPKDLWRLDHSAKGENPRLTKIKLKEGGKTLEIRDAIPWSDDTLLLATDVGLRAYAPAAQKLSRVDIPEPAQPATTLIRDGLGRIWLGTDKGLWLNEPGGMTLEAFDRVPLVSQCEVDALAPDPQHADGIIAAIRSRGVAFVRAWQKP
jgi:hypothetical protein